jgi:hypothetical protein
MRTVPPIVFVSIIDPVGAGLVERLARPGGNVTGFALFEYSLSAKWLELLKEIAPGVTRAAVLRDTAVGSGGSVRHHPGGGTVVRGGVASDRPAQSRRNRVRRRRVRAGAERWSDHRCYQWTPLKDVCLTQCQSPFQFLMSYGGFRGDVPGCLLLGLRHGAYCVGCCWVLMALLFVGGVMNVLWIALLALLILLEKLFRFGRWIARAAGATFLAGGAWLLFF